MWDDEGKTTAKAVKRTLWEKKKMTEEEEGDFGEDDDGEYG